jgi:hypothetical protein
MSKEKKLTKQKRMEKAKGLVQELELLNLSKEELKKLYGGGGSDCPPPHQDVCPQAGCRDFG